MKCFLPPAKLHMSQSCAQVTHNPAMLQALTCVVPLGWMPSPGRSYPSHLIPMWEALENAALDRFSTCLVVPAFSRLETELLHQIPCSCVVSSCHTMRYHFHFFSSRSPPVRIVPLWWPSFLNNCQHPQGPPFAKPVHRLLKHTTRIRSLWHHMGKTVLWDPCRYPGST